MDEYIEIEAPRLVKTGSLSKRRIIRVQTHAFGPASAQKSTNDTYYVLADSGEELTLTHKYLMGLERLK